MQQATSGTSAATLQTDGALFRLFKCKGLSIPPNAFYANNQNTLEIFMRVLKMKKNPNQSN